MKHLALTIIILSVIFLSLKAQDNTIPKTSKYKNQISDDGILRADTLNPKTIDKLNGKSDQYPMLTIDPPIGDMAQMPQMQIDSTKEYTMRIKHYDLHMSKLPEILNMPRENLNKIKPDN